MHTPHYPSTHCTTENGLEPLTQGLQLLRAGTAGEPGDLASMPLGVEHGASCALGKTLQPHNKGFFSTYLCVLILVRISL